MTVPDPNCRLNEETGSYDHSPLDWEEFHDVINGNGPCNADRLDHHRNVQLENTWVREAAVAYAQKTENALVTL